jgi:hypothetical protein
MDEICTLIGPVTSVSNPLDAVAMIVPVNCNEHSTLFATTFHFETISKFSMNAVHYLQQLFMLKPYQNFQGTKYIIYNNFLCCNNMHESIFKN